MSEILKCPFCGGEPELIPRGNAFTKKRSAEIKCGTCRVEMVVGAIHGTLDWCAKTVTEKWNKRVGITQEPMIGAVVCPDCNCNKFRKEDEYNECINCHKKFYKNGY